MTNLGLLLTEWRAALEEEANRTSYDRLLLTADVFYSSEYWASTDYPIQAIVDSLDWINVMAYDIYTPISSPTLTEPPAPLYYPDSSRFSVENGISAWIKSGVRSNFIVLGLPFHGRSWILVNENNHEILSPARGPVPGLDPVSYSKIVTITQPPAVEIFDPEYVTNFSIMGQPGLVTMVIIASLLRFYMQRTRDCVVTLHGMWATTLLAGLFQMQLSMHGTRMVSPCLEALSLYYQQYYGQ